MNVQRNQTYETDPGDFIVKKNGGNTSMKIKVKLNLESHQCEAVRDGDWIIYRCTECDYELRDNWRTDQLIVRNAKPEINHSGSYFPYEYHEAFTNMN